MSPPWAEDPPAAEDLGAEFACSCAIQVLDPVLWSITLWQCAAGEDCPAWRLISGGIEQCVRQLRIQALSGAILPLEPV